jgi:WD repeat-containing protein 68
MESYSSNHVTIVGLSGSSSNCYDPYDDPMNSFTNSTHPQLHPLATAPHPYPPTALAFSPIRLSESLQASSSSGQMVRTREMLATSSECIRLWDFAQGVAEDDRTSGFVSESRRLGLSQKGTSYQLVPRSQMANVSSACHITLFYYFFYKIKAILE